MTETTPAVVDDETYAITRVVLVRAHRSAVWAALTTPELMTEWFGDTATFDSFDVGSIGSLGWDDYGQFPIQIVELDEPSAFAYRWGQQPGRELDEESSTLVRFTLDDDPDGTRLTVVETGFNTLPGTTEYRKARAEDNRGGWNSELDELVAFLEKQDSV
ncbi:MAG: SRPBCC family protein [Pseudolysinimonas sp.]